MAFCSHGGAGSTLHAEFESANDHANLRVMRILVTGGAGFIGSHVADAALAAGHEVLVVDDLSTGKRHNVPERAAFEQVDIRNATALDAVVAGFKPDVVSHQGAQTSVSVSTREPIRDAEVNILGS